MKFSSTFVIISSSTLAAAFAPIGGEILYMIDLFFAVLMHYLEKEAARGGWGGMGREFFATLGGFVGGFYRCIRQCANNGQWAMDINNLQRRSPRAPAVASIIVLARCIPCRGSSIFTLAVDLE
jgi:hypothetical protein